MVDSIMPAALQQYSLEQQSAASKSSKELGQDEFLKLMMAQLKHQDPMQPLENGEFIAQMAQFSSVAGIEGMQESLDKLSLAYGSSQTLQASQLVGNDVMIESSEASLDGSNAITGQFDLTASAGNVTMNVYDDVGLLVGSQELGQHATGRHSFRWDGQTRDGNTAPPGRYSVQLLTTYGDEVTEVPALMTRTIQSVEFGSDGNAVLNTREGETLSLSDIRRIGTTD